MDYIEKLHAKMELDKIEKLKVDGDKILLRLEKKEYVNDDERESLQKDLKKIAKQILSSEKLLKGMGGQWGGETPPRWNKILDF